MELGDTSKLATDLAHSRHLNFHIRQSVAGAAAGTLRKHLQRWSFWSEWALECDTHPGKPTQADMADNLHEVVTGARQDRSRVRTSTISGAIQSVTFVSRKAQVEPLLAILDTPLVARHLAGAAASWPRRGALPLPLAVSSTVGAMDLQRIGARTRNPFQLVAFCSWCEQASASQTRSARVPRHCFQTDMS